MDADLQHPPEVIPQFIEKWREGYKNVYGERIDRATDPKLRAAFTHVFYRLLENFGDVRLPPGAGDFRLLDRQAVDALLTMRERARFNKGLFAWIGFKSIGVPFDVEGRAGGTSKFNFVRLARFALDGLMSFSSIPLKVWTYVGLAISAFAIAMAGYYLGPHHGFWRGYAGLSHSGGLDRLLLRRSADFARRARRVCRPHLQ